MKGVTVALDALGGGPAAARIVDGIVDDLLVDGPGAAPRPGTIFRAVADRPMKGQGGLTLRLPDDQRAFLRKIRGIAPGQPLLVQVEGYPREGKALPVTTRIALRGRYGVITLDAPGRNVSRAIRDPAERTRLELLAAAVALPGEAGIILRSACEGVADEDISIELADLSDLANAIAGEAAGSGPDRLLDGPDAHQRAWTDWPAPDTLDDRTGSFARHGLEEVIDGFRSPVAPLPAGASLIVEPTRALVAVDVNTGADTSPAAGLKANIAAARALPRALRCRGLGGQITIDFAPSPRKDRHRIEQALTAAFRADPVETALAGWTPLGHYELQRKQARLPLSEVPS